MAPEAKLTQAQKNLYAQALEAGPSGFFLKATDKRTADVLERLGLIANDGMKIRALARSERFTQ